jgi:hypothetical protein
LKTGYEFSHFRANKVNPGPLAPFVPPTAFLPGLALKPTISCSTIPIITRPGTSHLITISFPNCSQVLFFVSAALLAHQQR